MCIRDRVFVDKNAFEADGIVLCGRIKAHTAFRGPYESGLMKMAVIGMGKQLSLIHISIIPWRPGRRTLSWAPGRSSTRPTPCWAVR